MTKALVETHRFFLRELSTDDVTEVYLNWLRDRRTSRFIVTASAIEDLQSLKRYVAEKSAEPTVLFLGIFVKGLATHIGNIKFEPVNEVDGSAMMGILIGDEAWRGRGVAGEVLEACSRWLFEARRIPTMFLGVDRTNAAAVRAYLKAGFRFAKHGSYAAEDPSNPWMTRCYGPHQRLAIGTVQFGMRYGIANEMGQVAPEAVATILRSAWDAGLNTLDTAVGYGDSEQRLGETGIGDWQVISKLPVAPAAGVSRWVRETAEGSISRLKISKLRGLLLHRPQQLLEQEGDALLRALTQLRDEGRVEKIGVSVCDPEELAALSKRFQFDLVQAPFNIVDRRAATSGWLERLRQSGVEIHTRSAFLQGLLLMGSRKRPERFARWQRLWDTWDEWLGERALTPLQACLGYVLSQPEIDRVVVGVDSLGQFREILAAASTQVRDVPEELRSDDRDLINPSAWTVA